MKYKVNQKTIPYLSTRLQGHIDITFQELHKVLGEPIRDTDDKTQAEWVIEYNGVMCTIYDWKIAGNVEYNSNWNIGGADDRAVNLVRDIFPNSRVNRSRF
jgi:hypothetical protein